MSNKQISLYTYLSKQEEATEEILEKFRTFLRKGTRDGSKTNRAIDKLRTYNLSSIPKDGIWERLIIEDGKVSYIAGQDYTGEIKFLRELLVRAFK